MLAALSGPAAEAKLVLEWNFRDAPHVSFALGGNRTSAVHGTTWRMHKDECELQETAMNRWIAVEPTSDTAVFRVRSE